MHGILVSSRSIVRLSRFVFFSTVSLVLITASAALAQTQLPPETQPLPETQPPQSQPQPEPPQDWVPQAIESLRQNASSKTEFTLDHSMLVLASKMDQDDEGLRRVIAGVDGVSVHRFRFQSYGTYDPEILNAVRQEYHAAGWQHLAGSHAKDGGPGATDLWIRYQHNTIRNIAVLFAGQDQVNFVAVSGSISPIDLMHLGGHFGIPRIEGGVLVPVPRNGTQQAPPQDYRGY
jgi:Domain of unknown function (DUF4252)